ncbi:hypothetical protein [Actinophytocola xanthii]|uniref:Uncharacterized protein n=1 Tax=Actinophytocola xanthii TaxID=1912961 RepID=A0A1Q8C2K5_9PSEU|nr:hypothetical protein [Actinophytocola xanthii]OLF08574.1 hypothetical protein BU204_34340 [Actinophytocola xanthii]
MSTCDQAVSQLFAASTPVPFGAFSGAVVTVPVSSTSLSGQVPETEDVAFCRSAAEDWAAESGLTMQEFQRTYVEQRVAELMDQHPALRRLDAESLALTETPWLDDHAA